MSIDTNKYGVPCIAITLELEDHTLRFIDISCEEDWGNIDTTDFTDNPIIPNADEQDVLKYTGRCRFGNDEDGYLEIKKAWKEREGYYDRHFEMDLDDFCKLVDDQTEKYSS